MGFHVLDVEEFLKFPYLYDNPKNVIWIAKKGKRKKSYLELYCGFDIETYTNKWQEGYMYIWQFSIYGKDGNYIIIGRTWGQFVKLIDTLIYDLKLSSERRLLIGVANLSFEHQYMKMQFQGRWSKQFAKERRQPLYSVLDDCVEFRDVLMISGGSLATLAKEYTKTQKLVGDLDYSIPRNYKTELTEKELAYCYNDVAIVAEFMEYLFQKYIIPEKWIPLTKTGLLRREVKKQIAAHGSGVKRQIMHEVYRCFIPDHKLYSTMMRYLFRGGYTHSNIRHTGRVIDGVYSQDITSSYPYAMLAYDGFPVSPLKREDPRDFERLYASNKFCLMFSVIFTNLRAKTDHAIESKSKCVSVSNNAIIDNGRIRSCTQCEVWLTELDFTMYRIYYDFDAYKVTELYSSVRGRLPEYLLKPLAHAYERKAKMKKEGKNDTTEYALYKNLVNSAYGMCVTRLVESEVKMSDLSGKWYLDPTGFDYEEERKKAFLLPQWGIYICSFARFRILLAIYGMTGKDGRPGSDACYSDTDSVKFIGDHRDYFEKVNHYTKRTMLEVCKRYQLDPDLFDDLGSFEEEYEGKPVKAKFLGAKRYIIKDEKGYHTTIAGLPKKALNKHIDNLKIQWEVTRIGKYPETFDIFTDKMLLNAEVSLKNAHKYNDEPHRDRIAGVECFEQASVGIYPVDFTMNIAPYYMTLIKMMEERGEGLESRIY